MKHHFGDFLDREGGYWTIVPNRERYEYALGDVPGHSKEITIVTIGRYETHWKRIFTFPNLEELTLHEPNKEQLSSLHDLPKIKRLRITHARPKDLEFISAFTEVEELVLEYVSGFSDLSPLSYLKNLRALHIENLRRVSDFGGLNGIEALKYLHIDGTFDWKQPIKDFNFLKGLSGLEVFSLGQVITKEPFPALLPLAELDQLKKVKIPMNMFSVEEYALLEVGLHGVEGAIWKPCYVFGNQVELPKQDIRSRLPVEIIRANHPDISIRYDGRRMINDPSSEWYEFLGKSSGIIKRSSAKAEQKCAEHTERYLQMKEKAKRLLSSKVS